MSQPTKKPSPSAAPKVIAKNAQSNAQSAAHVTSKAMEKAARTALSTLETTHNSTKSVVNIGADTMKELFSNGTEEVQKTHAKVFAISREGTETVSRTLDALTRTLNDLVALNRENVDVVFEVNNIISDIACTATAELVKYANANFADNLDVCNEAFSCRNLHDVLELNNKWVSGNVNNFFSQATKFADMMFQFANEASEPVNEHLLESAERLSKSLAA